MTLPRTPSQTVGPYYAIGMCRGDTRGEGAIEVRGRLLDGEGNGVDGIVEAWDGSRLARSGTDADGAFLLRVDRAPFLDVFVFARGLLRHQATRMYFPGEPVDDVFRSLVAREEDGGLRFDIHLQGPEETVFFAV